MTAMTIARPTIVRTMLAPPLLALCAQRWCSRR